MSKKMAFYLDESRSTKYPEQGMQAWSRPEGGMEFNLYLPDCFYLIPENATETPDIYIENIAAICRKGHGTGGRQHHGSNRPGRNKSFYRDFRLGMRIQNSPEAFVQHPLVRYSMDIDFSSGFEINQCITNFSVCNVQKVRKSYYNSKGLKGLGRRLGQDDMLTKLNGIDKHVSMAVAFGFYCEENLLMTPAYHRQPPEKRSKKKGSLADRTIFFQGQIVRNKLPHYALDKNIPLLVSNTFLHDPETGTPRYLLLQKVKPAKLRNKSLAPITDPLSCPYALTDGLQMAAHASEARDGRKHKGFDMEELGQVKNKLRNFIINYNETADNEAPAANDVGLPSAVAAQAAPVCA